jgi:hypothetical protein
MGLFKKKKKDDGKTWKNSNESLGLPELPDFPNLPEIPKIEELSHKEKISKLPSFPHSAPNSKMNHDIVKQVINEDLDNNMEKDSETIIGKLPQVPKESLVQEVNDTEFTPKLLSSNYQVNTPFKQTQKTQQKKEIKQESIRNQIRQSGEEPLFIRVDKYKSAIEKIQESKHKLMEIEKVLRDIKDIRTKEEGELQEWENQIQEAKSKLDSADKILFPQV